MVIRHSLRRVIAALTMNSVACTGTTTEPPLPAGAVPIIAKPQYALWWRLAERCAGVSGDMGAINWYVVPDAAALGSDDVQGMYYPVSHRIVLAGRFAESAPLVRHEMLHALVTPREHPSEYFQNRCGGVVACDDVCLRDGGPLAPVDSGGAIIRVADLDVAARVDSTAPSLARDSGWIALTVELRNPRAYAVRAHLVPLAPGYFAAATYGYQRDYCDLPAVSNPTYMWRTDRLIVLGPGEVQRHVFDFQVWSVCTTIQPFFNDDTLSAIRVEPTP
jgi:hypothetical protein